MLLEQKTARSNGSPNSAILALRGKRLVWASETNEGRKLNVSLIKELVGGDTLNARGAYARRHVEFRPSHLLLLLTNNKPQVPPKDFAIWQRIHLIPFTQKFVPNPSADDECRADPKMLEKLKAEASGILSWMVRGCIAYQEGGLQPPEIVQKATKEYQRDENILANFLDDVCEMGPAKEVMGGNFYQAYKSWCNESGHHPLSATKFGREMKEVFDSYKDTNGTHYVGVSITQAKE
jgi:putative DNA primase/helicase